MSLQGPGASVPGRAHTSGVTPKRSLEVRVDIHRYITAGEGGIGSNLPCYGDIKAP